MMDSSFFKKKWVIIAGIAVFVAIVYSPSLRGEFVWDDYLVIVKNNFIKSRHNFPLIFTPAYLLQPPKGGGYLPPGDFVGSGETSYRPVVTISYFIDYQVWKLKPFGYHLTNLLLHVANCILAYLLFLLLTRNNRIAVVGALLFSVHPVTVESVSVISMREDLLTVFFSLLSFIFFMSLDSLKRGKRILTSFVSALALGLALFSKEMALIVPALFVAYDVLFRKDSEQRSLRMVLLRYAPPAGVVLFYSVVRFFLMQGPPAMMMEPLRHFNALIPTMLKVFLRYMQWLWLPVNVHPTLPEDPSLLTFSFNDPEVILSLAVLLLIVFLWRRASRTSPLACFGFSWFMLSFIPVSNIVFPLTNYFASRYLYLPLIGFCFLLGILFDALLQHEIFSLRRAMRQKIARDAVVVMLAFCSLWTYITTLGMSNELAFSRSLVRQYPQNGRSYFNLGMALYEKKALNETIGVLRQAIAINPKFDGAYYLLGVCYKEKGQEDKALACFNKTIESGPAYVPAYIQRGVILGEKGLHEEAIKDFQEALKRDSRFFDAYYNLAVGYEKTREPQKACQVLRQLLEKDPHRVDALAMIKRLGC